MSGDETLAFIVCALLAIFSWGPWTWAAASNRFFRPSPPAYILPWVIAPLSALILLAILVRHASHDVRDDALYLAFYVVMGGAVAAVGVILLDRLGLSLRDDVIERRNPAACVAWSGALLGLVLAYSGANIGDGPGWWVVVFCSGLSVGSLLLGWLLLDLVGQPGEAIVVERDLSAGVRVAGWFIGAGLILGRGAAGNWTTSSAAVHDFARHGTWALALTGVATVTEALLNHAPRPDRPWFLRGVPLGLAWLGVGVAYLKTIGRW